MDQIIFTAFWLLSMLELTWYRSPIPRKVYHGLLFSFSFCLMPLFIKQNMQVMVPHRYEVFVEEMTSLVESGKVPIARIDDAVERILRVKFAAGVFEFPFADRSLLNIVGCKVSIIQPILNFSQAYTEF